MHRLAGSIVAEVRDEAGRLAAHVAGSGELAWEDFIVAWWPVVLGDAARDDHQTTDLLTRLGREGGETPGALEPSPAAAESIVGSGAR